MTSRPRLKHFLAASDLSARAEKAVARATRLAEEHRAKLTVLHIAAGVAEIGTHNGGSSSKMSDLRRKIGAHASGTTPNINVLTGTPFVEIIRQTRKKAADLIVVGAHGEDFIKDFLLGTTAEKIVRKGDRPVLVVKQAPQRSYRRVLAAVDFSDNSRRALEFALQLAPQAEFHALHVYLGFEGMLKRASFTDSEIVRHQQQVAREARRQMEAFMRTVHRSRKPIRRELWKGQPRRDITAIAKRLRADLVVVGSAGRTGIPHILLGSVAEHVMREAFCDVLVARSKSLPFKLP